LWYSSLASKFVNTLKGLSFNINTDPESGCNSGVSNVARAADNSKATRQFSAVTYLPLAMARNNIEVLVGAQATKITFKSIKKILQATGVEFVAGGKKYFISAHKEVILSAGRSLLYPYASSES
jgi:choline dehydrogenase-like flavoprotein